MHDSFGKLDVEKTDGSLLGAFAFLRSAYYSFCLYACNVGNRRINFRDFDSGELRKLSNHFSFYVDRTNVTASLHGDLLTLLRVGLHKHLSAWKLFLKKLH